jgi:hypothetical protein
VAREAAALGSADGCRLGAKWNSPAIKANERAFEVLATRPAPAQLSPEVLAQVGHEAVGEIGELPQALLPPCEPAPRQISRGATGL